MFVAVVEPDVPVMVTGGVVPVMVTFSAPLLDALVFVSPMYCALIACVPSARPELLMVKAPLTTYVAGPREFTPSKSCTRPLAAVPVEVTEMENAILAFSAAFVLVVTEIVVVVVALLPPPPP